MTLGRAPEQGELWQSSVKYCEGKLSPTSIFSLLQRECHRLFPDDAFADLFQDTGRRSVPPSFVHTVLVVMRARLRTSKDPDRIFHAVLAVAKEAGMVGRRRVLDSTPLYDAVATQDTVTMIRSAIRGLLRIADETLAVELRGVLRREDDYASAGKPACDWEDKAAREALVD